MEPQFVDNDEITALEHTWQAFFSSPAIPNNVLASIVQQLTKTKLKQHEPQSGGLLPTPTSPSENFSASLNKIGEFNSVQTFWDFWQILSTAAIAANGTMRFFKQNILPMWETVENKNGGRFFFVCTRQHFNWVPIAITLSVIGEQFSFNEDINGLVIAARPNGTECLISLWMKGTYNKVRYDEISAEILQTILSFPQKDCDEDPKIRVGFKRHFIVNKRNGNGRTQQKQQKLEEDQTQTEHNLATVASVTPSIDTEIEFHRFDSPSWADEAEKEETCLENNGKYCIDLPVAEWMNKVATPSNEMLTLEMVGNKVNKHVRSVSTSSPAPCAGLKLSVDVKVDKDEMEDNNCDEVQEETKSVVSDNSASSAPPAQTASIVDLTKAIVNVESTILTLDSDASSQTSTFSDFSQLSQQSLTDLLESAVIKKTTHSKNKKKKINKSKQTTSTTIMVRKPIGKKITVQDYIRLYGIKLFVVFVFVFTLVLGGCYAHFK